MAGPLEKERITNVAEMLYYSCLVAGYADVGELLDVMRQTDCDVAVKSDDDHGPDCHHVADGCHWPENHLHIRLYLLHSIQGGPSKSVSICNRSRARLVDSSRNCAF